MEQYEREMNLIRKIEKISDRYHRLSLLFYELAQSLSFEVKTGKKSFKELKEILDKFNFKILEDYHIQNLKDLKKE